MSDLISKSALIDRLSEEAKKLAEKATNSKGQAVDYYAGAKTGTAKAAIIVSTEPTIDAVPVVRCKDCKSGTYYHGIYGCEVGLHDGDFFCADGERSEE